jgi:hypothetical protein
MSFAQINFVATLAHDGEFTQFYGSEALVSAYDVAVNGDIITLTSGTFTAPTFDKGITVRGVGIDEAEKTYIAGAIVTIQSTDSTQVSIFEGLVFNNTTRIYNHAESPNGQGTLNFIKCKFNSISEYSGSTSYPDRVPVVRFYNVVVTGNVSFYGYSKPNFVFSNSFVVNPGGPGKTNTSAFVNCVIEYPGSGGASFLNCYNCILNIVSPSSFTCSSFVLYNCLSIDSSDLKYSYGVDNSTYTESIADIFKTYTSGYTDGETFELNDNIKSLYPGTDGTQIGMQGGNYPFTTTVQYPIITKFQPEATTDKDGKLSINLEVDGE